MAGGLRDADYSPEARFGGGLEVNPAAAKYGKIFPTSSGKLAGLNPYKSATTFDPNAPRFGIAGSTPSNFPTAPTVGVGGGGGGKGATGPVVNFDPSKFKQDIQPNPFQTKAYEKMEQLYDEVPDYYKRALAEGRTAATGTFDEVQGMMGSRGFGPGSGLTTSQMLKAKQYADRNILGGQLAAAEQTFGARAGLAGQMGGLGTNIGQLMNNAFMNNVGAYNALASYALGADANRIAGYNAETGRLQAETAPMMAMWNMALQAMQFL